METEIDTFRHLNTDVLLQVFEHLRPDRDLRSLSMSCRWIRQESMDVLFRSCLVIVKEPLCAERFLPQSLWPYVCHLSLRDDCPDKCAMSPLRHRRHELRFTEDPLLCGTMDPRFLKTTLQAMPRIRSLYLAFWYREIHGIGWDNLEAILSTPLLRSVTVEQFLFSPRQAPMIESIERIAPLTTFRFKHRVIRGELRDYPIQEATLGLVIGKLRHTLESLLLPSEVTPFRALASNQWPRLRELHLMGEIHSGPDIPIPFVTLFSGMPKLRTLKLQLALPWGIDRQILQLWPKDYEAQFPWQELDDLTMSFPCSEDQIYSRLPRTMQRLSLRCTPYYHFSSWRRHPLLVASAMLEILSKVDTPSLKHLELEYRADAAENDLLLCLTQKFPRLTSLEIHRFLPFGGGGLTFSDIALRVAKLKSLLTLRAYLDPGEPTEFTMLEQTAATLASKLARPDFKLWLLRMNGSSGRWYPFCLAAEQNTDQEARAEIDLSNNKGKGIAASLFEE
ncbi:uncharacterized protein C8Q71DRAFT_371990 [Rhodofomes roseus]|uniref:F-box domain-containing protein n=1 Tax=Rhodofomes roseus TaxID=34475 RepID=A0ABQ8K0R0_9APHY|nr:uncharacterized protein C8Q71DRAFT_371990 [Rhodofomes roseus]KAH9830270.1 hypothetical protein C8Q71DRAFT_371990 [Rhodofomes roseus]